MSKAVNAGPKSNSDRSGPSQFPRDVYELLDFARNRPGMYGIGSKSFRLLEAFLAGLSWTTVDEGTPQISDFPMWLGVCMGGLNPSAPLLQMKKEHTDSDAYELWFEMLDAYRQCRIVELARLPASVLRSMPYPYEMNGVRVPSLVPDWICIGQYAGSNVFFLGESNAGQFNKHIFELTDSLEKIFQQAKRRWQVERRVWGTVKPCDDPGSAAAPEWTIDAPLLNRVGSGQFPLTTYELLDQVRNRPAIYGVRGKSYRLLKRFLSGLSWKKQPEDEPSLWDFRLWAAATVGEGESSQPLHTLSLEYDDEAAYVRWFELLDDYRKCAAVQLARLPASASPREEWGYTIDKGRHTPIEPPEWMLIGRFPPSDIYFLAQVRDGITNKHYWFQPSLKQAFAEAYRWWAIDYSLWQLEGQKTNLTY